MYLTQKYYAEAWKQHLQDAFNNYDEEYKVSASDINLTKKKEKKKLQKVNSEAKSKQNDDMMRAATGFTGSMLDHVKNKSSAETNNKVAEVTDQAIKNIDKV